MFYRTPGGRLAAIFAIAPSLMLSQIETMHQDDGGGGSNTVTVYLRSRVMLDRGLLGKLGQGHTFPKEELWQHGHSGPQLLRVINPARTCKIFGGGKPIRKETGNTMVCDTDTVKVEVVASPTPPSTLNGLQKVGDLVITRRQIPNAGAFTNGHLFGTLSGPADACVDRLTKAPLMPKIPEYIRESKSHSNINLVAGLIGWFNPALKESPGQPSKTDIVECLKREVMRNIASASGSGSAADLDTTWVYKLEGGSGFTWESLDPVASNAGRHTVVDEVKGIYQGDQADTLMTKSVLYPHTAGDSATFEFRLKDSNGAEKYFFRDLRVYSAGSTTPRFKRRINPGGNFTICKNDEQTGQPDCVKLPDVKPLKVPEANCCRPKGHGGHH